MGRGRRPAPGSPSAPALRSRSRHRLRSRGGRLASGHEDGTVRFWDARRRRLESTLSGHTGPVYAVAFGPGGRTFASGGGDDTAALWLQDDQDRWRRLDEPLRGHTGTVASVVFAPDGHTLATGSWDRTARIWNVDQAWWRQRACTLANRNLTMAEWDQFVGTARRYEPTCAPPADAAATRR